MVILRSECKEEAQVMRLLRGSARQIMGGRKSLCFFTGKLLIDWRHN